MNDSAMQRLKEKWTTDRRHYLRKAESDLARRDYWHGAALALTKCRAELTLFLRRAGVKPTEREEAKGSEQEAA